MRKRRRSLYAETLIRANCDEVWRLTQEPGQHQRWDLRFTRIEYAEPEPGIRGQRFTYSLGAPPVLQVAGTGICSGERVRPNGTRTSVLRFASGQRLSLIRSGSGYWRYVPTAGGTRFLTGYDYEPGWGLLGRPADRLFRPVLGWATAWSFDRLRLWLECGIPPERSLRRWAADIGLRTSACVAAWLITPGSLAVVMTLIAAWLPPRRSVPAARRCLRRPPDRLSAAYPADPPPLAPAGHLDRSRPARAARAATARPSVRRLPEQS